LWCQQCHLTKSKGMRNTTMHKTLHDHFTSENGIGSLATSSRWKECRRRSIEAAWNPDGFTPSVATCAYFGCGYKGRPKSGRTIHYHVMVKGCPLRRWLIPGSNPTRTALRRMTNAAKNLVSCFSQTSASIGIQIMDAARRWHAHLGW
jgi:hypothetical protein